MPVASTCQDIDGAVVTFVRQIIRGQSLLSHFVTIKNSGSVMGPSSETINASVTQSVSQLLSPETFLT